ncbi:MAG: hypothetical protein EOS48_16575 [Mesorhizobium sp.]|nr:MAG: hypothetical protein EOS48_16575 [Mesorhizobium sp.]
MQAVTKQFNDARIDWERANNDHLTLQADYDRGYVTRVMPNDTPGYQHSLSDFAVLKASDERRLKESARNVARLRTEYVRQIARQEQVMAPT